MRRDSQKKKKKKSLIIIVAVTSTIEISKGWALYGLHLQILIIIIIEIKVLM